MQYNQFIKEIMRIKSSIESGENYVFDQKSFQRAFLWDCSKTPGNLSALEHIEYNDYFDKERQRKCYGLKVKNKDITVSDIFFNAIECNNQVINSILEQYPQLTTKEIEAILRFITVILTELDSDGYEAFNS